MTRSINSGTPISLDNRRAEAAKAFHALAASYVAEARETGQLEEPPAEAAKPPRRRLFRLRRKEA